VDASRSIAGSSGQHDVDAVCRAMMAGGERDDAMISGKAVIVDGRTPAWPSSDGISSPSMGERDMSHCSDRSLLLTREA